MKIKSCLLPNQEEDKTTPVVGKTGNKAGYKIKHFY